MKKKSLAESFKGRISPISNALRKHPFFLIAVIAIIQLPYGYNMADTIYAKVLPANGLESFDLMEKIILNAVFVGITVAPTILTIVAFKLMIMVFGALSRRVTNRTRKSEEDKEK